jgi:hypothetical protein
MRSPPIPFRNLRAIYDQALRNNTLKSITIVREEFWRAIAIHKNPEILSGTNLRLVPEQDGSLWAEDSATWLDDLQRLDIQSEAPELKFAVLERYATSRFDLQRIYAGKSGQASLSTYENKALVSLLCCICYRHFSMKLRYLTRRSEPPWLHRPISSI